MKRGEDSCRQVAKRLRRTLQRDEALTESRLDAHHIVFRFVEGFLARRVRQKSLAAERELRLVALDGCEFSLLLPLGQLEPAKLAIGGSTPVDNIRRDVRLGRRFVNVVSDGAMIRVLIEAGRTDDQRRLKIVYYSRNYFS